MQTNNPAFKNEAFAPREWGGIMSELDRPVARPGAMSLEGTVIKTGILLALCVIGALAAAQMSLPNPYGLTIGASILGFILSIVICIAPRTSPFLAPVYAVVEGLFLGVVSKAVADRAGPTGSAMVTQAVGLTFGTFAVMLGCYATGIIKGGPTFTKILIIATLGVFLTVVASIILSFCGVHFLDPIHGSGPVGIGFSLIVVGLAALNLILDFQMAQNGIRNGAPKYMEWFAGFGMLVTIVWLYLEILRLLSKLNKRN